MHPTGQHNRTEQTTRTLVPHASQALWGWVGCGRAAAPTAPAAVLSHVKNQDGLDIEEDIAFQRRFWRLRQVGWLLMIAFVVAGLVGLLGGGGLSSAEVSDPAGRLQVRYDRVQGFLMPTQLEVSISAAGVLGSIRSIWTFCA